jgi:hypothetical protein
MCKRNSLIGLCSVSLRTVTSLADTFVALEKGKVKVETQYHHVTSREVMRNLIDEVESFPIVL